MLKYKIDGYQVGDRLLEGVWFAVEIDEQALKVLSVSPFNRRDLAYLSDLNLPKWLKEIEAYTQGELDNSFDMASRSEPDYLDEFHDYMNDCGFYKV